MHRHTDARRGDDRGRGEKSGPRRRNTHYARRAESTRRHSVGRARARQGRGRSSRREAAAPEPNGIPDNDPRARGRGPSRGQATAAGPTDADPPRAIGGLDLRGLGVQTSPRGGGKSERGSPAQTWRGRHVRRHPPLESHTPGSWRRGPGSLLWSDERTLLEGIASPSPRTRGLRSTPGSRGAAVLGTRRTDLPPRRASHRDRGTVRRDRAANQPEIRSTADQIGALANGLAATQASKDTVGGGDEVSTGDRPRAPARESTLTQRSSSLELAARSTPGPTGPRSPEGPPPPPPPLSLLPLSRGRRPLLPSRGEVWPRRPAVPPLSVLACVVLAPSPPPLLRSSPLLLFSASRCVVGGDGPPRAARRGRGG